MFTPACRRYLAFVALLICILGSRSFGADASSGDLVLKVVTDRPDALYKVGDTVTFNISLKKDGSAVNDAEIHWTTSKDGVQPTNSGTLKLADGAGIVAGKLLEPGFLQCRVSFMTEAKTNLVAVAGAGFEPTKIKPSLPVPADFDAFWAEQKQKLALVAINPRLTPVKSTSKEVECWDLQADSVGAPVSGYFARPIGAKPKSLPIILTVQGAGVRSSSLGGAIGWAKQGFLAMDINAHGIPNGRPEQYYSDLDKGELNGYRTRGKESRDTIYFLGMFLRLVRAIDFLTAQPEWDGRTVVVHGSSQGGAQSIVAAGLDPRVTFFAAGVPAMCDHTGFLAGRINGWPKFIPSSAAELPNPTVIESVRYYDAMNFATRTKAPGIITVGFIDTTCPPTSVYAAYNALATSKQIFNDPPSTHAVSKEAGEAMKKAILEHVHR